ncbi:MAG: hypothetical protein H6661_09500 [Ardenticatenaceae bacterium]|nr:hypothetical protein [Ardenticatenaceae bacterium]
MISTAVNHGGLVRKDPAPFCLFEGFGESSIDFTLVIWMDEPLLEAPPGALRSLLHDLGCSWRSTILKSHSQRDLNFRGGWEEFVQTSWPAGPKFAVSVRQNRIYRQFESQHDLLLITKLIYSDGAALLIWTQAQDFAAAHARLHRARARAHLGELVDQLQATTASSPRICAAIASHARPRLPARFYQRDADDMAAPTGQCVACGPWCPASDGAEMPFCWPPPTPELVRGVVAWGVSGVISPEMVTAVQSRVPVPAKSNWGEWHRSIAALHGAKARSSR